MVIGRVFRGIGRFAGRIHGRVFRALGRLPLVGGAFKMVGNLTAKAAGMLGQFSPLAMLGLGSYSPSSSYLSGFSQASLQEQNGRPMQQMGQGFNNMYSQPPSCGGYGYNSGQFGSPFGMYPAQQNCCCCCGYRGF